MIEFLTSNWMNIAVIIIFLAVIVLLYKYNRRDIVRKIILSLVAQAEKAYGSGTGEIKYAYVIDKYYNCLPSIIRVLYTRKEIDTFIDEGVSKIKELLASGKNINSYDDEIYIKTLKDNT